MNINKYKIIKIKNEKLYIPKKIKKKLKNIINKQANYKIVKKIKETKKNYIVYLNKNNQNLKKFKIISNFKNKKIIISKYNISYFKDNLTEEYNINPNFPFYYDNIKKIEKLKYKSNKQKINKYKIYNNEIFEIDNFLTKKEVKTFLKIINNIKCGKVPANGKFNTPIKRIGAERCYIYSKSFAKILKKKVLKIIDKKLTISNKNNSIDYVGIKKWKLKEVNPLYRIIKYKKYGKNYGGRLIQHYDYPYDKNNKEKSLKTLLIYLTTNQYGKTRFLKDDIVKKRQNKTLYLKDYEDKDIIPNKKDIIKKIQPLKAKAIIFDHRLLHDVEELKIPEEKIVIFTDIIYKKI